MKASSESGLCAQTISRIEVGVIENRLGVDFHTIADGKHYAFESYLMQDEPEGGYGFSHKMSLKERLRMLGIEDQRARRRTIEPGADPGVFRGQPGAAV